LTGLTAFLSIDFLLVIGSCSSGSELIEGTQLALVRPSLGSSGSSEGSLSASVSFALLFDQTQWLNIPVV